MTSPRVSIVTPTRERARFLPRIAHCVLSQRVDWEWRVLDDSAAPDPFMRQLAARDARVHYVHDPAPVSIGAKRNALVAASRAPVIAHFDDDDVYTPAYLERMLGALEHSHADLLKLSAFFLYAPACDFFGYTDLAQARGWHYELTPGGFAPFDMEGERAVGQDFLVFYGFSCVYRREPALRLPYEDISLLEDARFAAALVNGGYKLATTHYATRDCLHWVHPASTARTIAGYRIPTFLLPELFPLCAELDAAHPLVATAPSPSQPGAAG